MSKVPPGERLFAALPEPVDLLVPWYLMASYAYYHRDEPLLLDGTYDALCKRLDAVWDRVLHPHRDVVDRTALRAGSCLLGLQSYPRRAVASACRLLDLPE